MLLSLFGLKAQEFSDAIKFSGGGNEYVIGTAYDSKGNIYVTGLFEGSMSFGSTTLMSDGSLDVFLVKMNAKKQVQWVRQIGSSDLDIVSDILIDKYDNVVVTGSFESDIVIYDPNGTDLSSSHTQKAVFVVQYASNGDVEDAIALRYTADASPKSLATSKSGDVYLAGQIEFSSTNYDVFISILPLNGGTYYYDYFGGAYMDIVTDLEVDQNNELYITGYYSGTLDLVDFSTINLTATGLIDGFIMVLDNFLAFQTILEVPSDNSSSQIRLNDLSFVGNDMYLVGSFAGSASFGSTTISNTTGTLGAFYSKINHKTSTNEYLIDYVEDLSTSTGILLNKVKNNSKGDAFIAGIYSGTLNYATSKSTKSKGEADLYIAKLTSTGAIDYLLATGSTLDDNVTAISISKSDEVNLSGYVNGTTVFGKSTLTNTGNVDGFIVNITEIVPEITFDNAPSQVCQGATFNVTVSGTDLEAGNEFVVLLSDASGSFSTTTQIGKLSSTTGGVISVTVPKSITASDNYKLRVTSSKPSLSTDYLSDIYISELPKTPKILGPIKVNEFADAKYSTVLNISSIYNWSVNNGNQLDGGTTNSVTVQWGSNGEGRISVVETDPLGCKSDTGELIVQVGKITGFDEVAEKELEIYPTLATNEITLKTTFDMQNAVYQIVSTDGKVFENKAVSNASVQVINISDLPKGAYFIKLISKDATSIARFQKI